MYKKRFFSFFWRLGIKKLFWLESRCHSSQREHWVEDEAKTSKAPLSLGGLKSFYALNVFVTFALLFVVWVFYCILIYVLCMYWMSPDIGSYKFSDGKSYQRSMINGGVFKTKKVERISALYIFIIRKFYSIL